MNALAIESSSLTDAVYNAPIEAKILLSLASMNKRQIIAAMVKYKLRFGSDIRQDIGNDKSISLETKRAVMILLKGTDQIKNIDVDRIKCLAVTSNRTDLLQVVALIASARKAEVKFWKGNDCKPLPVCVVILTDYQDRYNAREHFSKQSKRSVLNQVSAVVVESKSNARAP